MTMLRKTLGATVIAAMLATSATPALARPGWGGYGRHWHHHDGDGFGNFLLGAVVAGGIVALASSASGAQHDRGGVSYGDAREDRPSDEAAQDSRNWTDAENSAADACADGAEALASRRGIENKVDDIRYVDPDRNGYRVEGVMQDGRPFSCGINRGELTYIQFGDRVASR